MSRTRYRKSAYIARRRARETEQLIFSALLLAVILILSATGLWSALFAWIGELIQEQLAQSINS